MANKQTEDKAPEVEALNFFAPTQKYEFKEEVVGVEGAYIEYVPFGGADVLSLETRPQTEAVSAFYELAEKYATEIVMPVKGKDGSVELRTVAPNQYRQIPYAFILKFVQSAMQGELSGNFTKQ